MTKLGEGGDRVVADVDQLPASSGITTVVCGWSADHPARATALARVISTEVTAILVQSPCDVPGGFTASAGDHGWTLLRRTPT